MRRRLDLELVRRGLAPSRSAARDLVDAGLVRVSGAVATKSARLVDAGEPVLVGDGGPRYVSRGGHKLERALERVPLPTRDAEVLDAGASTGGFTDCLLQRGASMVVAVDVGHGQLHERLRSDPRVVVRERTNVRDLEPAWAPTEDGLVDGVVADVSFISLRTVLPALRNQLRPGGWMVLLVKPQFEAGRTVVDRGAGVVRDPRVWTEVLRTVCGAVEDLGGAIMDVVDSPIRGAAGNVEFLLAASFAEAPQVIPSGDGPSGTGASTAVDAAVTAASRRWAAEVSE